MTTRFIRILFFVIFSWTTPIACAMEYIEDGKFNSTVSSSYDVQIGDTLAGYPIFANDGDWILEYTNMRNVAGFASSIRLATIGIERRDKNGEVIMSQLLTVNLNQSGSNSWWTGEPCGGEKIIKIKIARGKFDRCATSEIKVIKVRGVDTETLRLVFAETNSGGRAYTTDFYILFKKVGIARSEVLDKSSSFNLRLKDWMDKFLSATVKAASYDKPPDAFNGVQTFEEGTRTGRFAITGTPPSNIAEELRQETERKAKQLDEERLRVAKARERLEAEKLQRQPVGVNSGVRLKNLTENDLVLKLEKLKELYTKGLINKEQYDIQVKEELGKL